MSCISDSKLHRLPLLLLTAGQLVGCMQSDETSCPDREPADSRSYVTLSFTMSGQTTGPATAAAGNPTGGENGDGEETGQEYENQIHSAVAFIYKAKGDDPVADRSQPVQPIRFTAFTTTADHQVQTRPVQVELKDGTYRVLVVVNPDNLAWTESPGLTLGTVLEHIAAQAWTEPRGTYSHFLMASANGAAELTLQSNPEDRPATAEVEVERLAARLDYAVQGQYTCTNPSYAGATVEITGAALVNGFTEGSYLFKRVASEVDGAVTYFGRETVDATGIATNYVIDPWTAQKTPNALQMTATNGQSKEIAAFYSTYFPTASANPSWWNDYVQPGTDITDQTPTGTVIGNITRWKRIGYTLENTASIEASGQKYNTGVVFKARFKPALHSVKGNYKAGQTFFAWGKDLYATMTDMMTACYGKEFETFDEQIEQCSDGAALKAFATKTLVDSDPSGYCHYLRQLAESMADDAQLTEGQKETMKWKAYMKNQCGYEETSQGVQLGEVQGKSTREVLKPYGVRTYQDATCYYMWWVRHANDGDDTKISKMEYAVVRNNIYKLTVSSVYSLGGDVPGNQPLGVQVYVKNWTLLPTETLPM